MRCQIVCRVPPRRHADRAHTKRSATVDIGRRIADDHHAITRHGRTKERFGAPLRNGRQLGAFGVVATECVHAKTREVDPHRTQFSSCARFDVARQQSHGRTLMGFDRVKQRQHTSAQARGRGVALELQLESSDVRVQRVVHAL